jgi:hypothetical protein
VATGSQLGLRRTRSPEPWGPRDGVWLASPASSRSPPCPIQTLAGRKVAVLATDGFEQSELEKPVEALKAAGARGRGRLAQAGQIQGWEHHDKGRAVAVDRDLASAQPADYDAIVCRAG